MKIILLPDVDFFDLPGWEARLEELRAQDDDVVGRDDAIYHAQTMIDMLTENPAAPVETSQPSALA
jgi:hypothetical protein